MWTIRSRYAVSSAQVASCSTSSVPPILPMRLGFVPLKDTVGPSLDILIKIMSVVSLVTVVVFSRYNLLDWIMGLFK